MESVCLENKTMYFTLEAIEAFSIYLYAQIETHLNLKKRKQSNLLNVTPEREKEKKEKEAYVIMQFVSSSATLGWACIFVTFVK